jgi:hypothetical protein
MPITGRASKPETRRKRLFIPYIRLVTVIGFSYNFELDAGFFGMILPEQGSIYGTLKSRVGGMQFEDII